MGQNITEKYCKSMKTSTIIYNLMELKWYFREQYLISSAGLRYFRWRNRIDIRQWLPLIQVGYLIISSSWILRRNLKFDINCNGNNASLKSMWIKIHSTINPDIRLRDFVQSTIRARKFNFIHNIALMLMKIQVQ